MLTSSRSSLAMATSRQLLRSGCLSCGSTTSRTILSRSRLVSHRQLSNETPRSNEGGAAIRTARPRLTKADVKHLGKHYEKEQIAALLDGEVGMSSTDFDRRKLRKPDAFSLPYVTDLSKIDPFLDFAPHGVPKSGRWPTQPVPQLDNAKFKQGDEDEENKLKDLSQLAGLPISYLETLKLRTLVAHRVTNQTRLGKIARQYVLTVAGDGNGMIGIGEASSTAAESANRLSQYQAIKNMKPIVRYEDRTIYGNVSIKFGAVELMLMSRPPGFGVRCSQYIFEICRCAGITDLGARVTRSRNPMNVIKATIKALMSQRTPDFIARGRGKKIVDVRKAYYGRHIY